MSTSLAFGGAERSKSKLDQRPSAGRPKWFEIARTLHRLPVLMQYSLATTLVLLTLALRHAFGESERYQFVYFMPAILLTSTVLRHGSGIWAVALSAILMKFFFIPPLLSLWFTEMNDLLPLTVFVGSSVVTAVMGGALHKALFQLADANERIAASEHEKELLLHELAHRFKNDLSNLTAILHLQIRSACDPLVRSELMIASQRIHVLDRVHQRLTRFDDATDVDVQGFLTDLCEDLRVSMVGGRPIELEMHAERTKLPYPIAITLGFIVNELVQNALKYAFPGDRSGRICVRFCRNEAEYHLTVADGGVGNAKPSPTSSGLGQRLIRSFVRQLHGTYKVKIEGGRCIEVKFPADPHS